MNNDLYFNVNSIYDNEDFSVGSPPQPCTTFRSGSGAEEPLSCIEKPSQQLTIERTEASFPLVDDPISLELSQENEKSSSFNSLENDENFDIGSVIDSEWLHNTNRLQNIHSDQKRELMESIGLHFIYINKNLYIEKILYEKKTLEKNDSESFIAKETILKIIQDKKISTPFSKYKLIDILSFVIDIEHDHIKNSFDDPFFNDDSRTFLKVLPIFNDIIINKSIFVFHNINQIYFIFQEYDAHPQHRSTLRSILKNTSRNKISSSDTSSNSTKKVRISTNYREHFKNKKGTRFTKHRR
jgi:hypothetical protein